MTFIIASVVVVLIFVVGGLLAWAFKGWDRAITATRDNIENEEKAYNPALTLGHSINSQAAAEEQVKEARKLAAKQAAALPRGANMRIGYKDDPTLVTAGKGLDQDPWTASKIASIHGWDGAKAGIPAGGVPEGGGSAAAAATPAAAAAGIAAPKLIEITDDMPADEVRKARIANSKAKSAFNKQLKAAGIDPKSVEIDDKGNVIIPEGAQAPAAATAQPAAGQASAPASGPVDLAAMGISAPVLTEISDDMPPDEVRKARIANSKAKSAFNKQLKAAGIDPKSVEIDDKGNVIMPEAAPALATTAAQPAAVQASAPASGPVDLAAMGISAPELTEITDDMAPDEVRKARIANSKAKSAFNKQLKAAGIDPKQVEIEDSGKVVMAEGSTPAAAAAPAAAPAAETEAPAPAPAADDDDVDLAALGITPPELVEISDDLSPDEKRQARISNSKAKSAFNKQLKAAGIDPKSVKL